MKCASCGAAVHPAADFCGVCGGDAPRAEASSAPRLSGMGLTGIGASVAARFAALRNVRIPGASSVRLPSLSARPARGSGDAGRSRGTERRDTSGTSGGSAAAMRASAPAIAMPRVSQRALGITGSAVAGIVIALLLANAALGADDGSTARELAAAKTAIEQRDAKIAALEGTVATNTQMQSALQSSAQSTTRQNDILKTERDSATQEVTALEAKLQQTETSLKGTQATITKQTADLRTLSSCLNGTSVALAFGRSGRWSSADLALGAVAAACKASESLLQR